MQKSLELIGGAQGATAREKLQIISKKAQQLFDRPGTHIVPIVIGDDFECVKVAKKYEA